MGIWGHITAREGCRNKRKNDEKQKDSEMQRPSRTRDERPVSIYRRAGGLHDDQSRIAPRHHKGGRDVPHGLLHLRADRTVLLHQRLQLRVVVLDREPPRATGDDQQPRALDRGRIEGFVRVLDHGVERQRRPDLLEVDARERGREPGVLCLGS